TGFPGATEVARPLRAIDACAAIGAELIDRVAIDTRRARAVAELRSRCADGPLRAGPSTVAVFLPGAALIAVHVAVATGVHVTAGCATNRTGALRSTARERFAPAAALGDAAGRSGRVPRHA